MGYPKLPYKLATETTILRTSRHGKKRVKVRRSLPGNVIVVHGVNDVGTSYAAVEEGLCQGLRERLFRGFTPGVYSNPTEADKDRLYDDPDDVFFKRKVNEHTNSPIIPFYWGYRERSAEAKSVNGQKTDRYGNRLDKDLSKGGGPFGNATSTLPDMWNKGICSPIDISVDPLRPLCSAPGRMYMVLAAERLAALISMIRDYDDNEVVTIVAHSQGCMLSLLAQAMLMERGARPADTLILTHPPYSLEDDPSGLLAFAGRFHSGTDAAMEPHYGAIASGQTMHARLQTLVNIVRGVVEHKPMKPPPEFAKMDDNRLHFGMVEKPWKAVADRDNRNKVYLYFCPEDMTVALENIQGIGWQGVPDVIEGAEVTPAAKAPHHWFEASEVAARGGSVILKTAHHALKELGPGFRQRVFTAKQRLDPRDGKVKPTLVGQAPHDFALRIRGEDDHAHIEADGRSHRQHFQAVAWPVDSKNSYAEQRQGIRSITGEALHRPVMPDLRGSQVDADKIPPGSIHAKVAPKDRGPCESVDPIDASIAPTARGGFKSWNEPIRNRWPQLHPSPRGTRRLNQYDLDAITLAYNKDKGLADKSPDDQRKVLEAFLHPDGTLIGTIQESQNECRLRWQHEVSPKSFHGAIIGSAENHRHVTAYDVAIGGGMASSDPRFHAYLCAVADWRLKKPESRDKKRPSILLWQEFLKVHEPYWNSEKLSRKELIEGNSTYYSTGELPTSLPVLTGALWDIVICETHSGRRINPPKEKT